MKNGDRIKIAALKEPKIARCAKRHFYASRFMPFLVSNEKGDADLYHSA